MKKEKSGTVERLNVEGTRKRCFNEKAFGSKSFCVLFFSFSIILLLVLLSGCGGEPDKPAAPPPRPAMLVSVEKASVRDLTRHAVYTGAVEPVRVARMASPAEGPVTECTVREGDFVVKEQTLVRVGRSRIAESNLAAAQEDLERQKSEFKRVERLVESGALPGEQLEIGRAALRRAEAQVAAAETSFGDYDIRAPWDGVVSDVFVSEGNYVTPRAALVDIYDPGSLRVRFAVPERDVRMIEVGVMADVALDAFPGRTFEARIERIYPRIDPATRTFMVEADVLTDEPLFNGLFARVATPLETLSGVVSVPSGALVAMPDETLVVFVAHDGKAVRRAVKAGLETGGYTQIIEGLTTGEAVVSRGQESLRDGAAIRILGAAKPGAGMGKGGGSQ